MREMGWIASVAFSCSDIVELIPSDCWDTCCQSYQSKWTMWFVCQIGRGKTMISLPWGQGQWAWFSHLGQTDSSTHGVSESPPSWRQHLNEDSDEEENEDNQTSNMCGRVEAAAHHQTLTLFKSSRILSYWMSFHTCWSTPDEFAYLKFSRIFSKTFGWNVRQQEREWIKMKLHEWWE